MNVEVVHHHLNGNKNELNNGLNGNKHEKDDLKIEDDEDEGVEGKSIEDLEKSKSDDNLKSNGTPTSGIVDDDDSFLELDTINDLNNLNSTVDNNKTHSHHNAELLKGFTNKNETEIKTIESANNSTINDGDITVDSVKEHFNNLGIRQNVDLLLDHKDGKNRIRSE